jgi:hypothetical protein
MRSDSLVVGYNVTTGLPVHSFFANVGHGYVVHLTPDFIFACGANGVARQFTHDGTLVRSFKGF